MFHTHYERLRKVAGAIISKSWLLHVEADDLVHEFYLKLNATRGTLPRTEGHFLALCVRVLRQVFIDLTRRTAAEKRGLAREVQCDVLPDVPIVSSAESELFVVQVLIEVATLSKRGSEALVLSAILGMSDEEVAQRLGMSVRTTQRQLHRLKKQARVYLR